MTKSSSFVYRRYTPTQVASWKLVMSLISCCLVLHSHVEAVHMAPHPRPVSPNCQAFFFWFAHPVTAIYRRCGCCACDHDWCHLNANTSMIIKNVSWWHTSNQKIAPQSPIAVCYWKCSMWDDVHYHPLSWLVVGMICIGFTTVSTKHQKSWFGLHTCTFERSYSF